MRNALSKAITDKLMLDMDMKIKQHIKNWSYEQEELLSRNMDQ